MNTATALRHTHVEEFVADDRSYRWIEGNGAQVRTLRHTLRREQLPELFARAVAPQMERRGAARASLPAAAPDGTMATDVRWVAWSAPGERDVVWGLYAVARRLEARAQGPANDTLVLIAWGDGPVLAWADERAMAHHFLRSALRRPPPWLARGMCSGDPTFPVRVEQVAGADATPALPRDTRA
jgi:hypothetical protein